MLSNTELKMLQEEFEQTIKYSLAKDNDGNYTDSSTQKQWLWFKKIKEEFKKEKETIVESHQNKIKQLFSDIEHGDDEHRQWLKEKIEKFFNIKIK